MNYLAEAINNPALGETLKGETGVSFFQSTLPAIVVLVLVIGTIIFFFVLIAGAVGWITSGGDKAKVEVARGRITNALVGLVVLFATFAIVQFIESFFSINILKLNFESLNIKP